MNKATSGLMSFIFDTNVQFGIESQKVEAAFCNFKKPLIIQNTELRYQVNEFFQFANTAPSFLLSLSPDSYTLHSLSPKTRCCTSSSSSFSFLSVGLSATSPSPSRVLCGNQRTSLISLISCMLNVIVILMTPRTFVKRSIVVMMMMMMKNIKIIKLKDHMR
ncbi:uncharacterized protein LOC126590299 [Malus sylvestris]|uniref:uncharacterized protein LOC126590299 n=1 Tax=Malus sylvestris TaxID=3752 RepID=UPI0021ACB85B|nr:uncharacterized protein LOC126590299 [Malus sylvestris]